MSLLPEDPKDQYRLLGAIVLLAAGALYYLYVHKPKTADFEEMAQRIEEIEFQNDLAEARMENLEAVRRDLELGERQFAVLERLVPARGEIPAIYEAIASQSQTLGLQLISVVPVEPETVPGGYFLVQNWDMEVEGQYHDIGAFLSRVASFDRIVRPAITEITPAGETNSGRQLVRAKFGLETFVLPPEGVVTEEVGTTEGGGDSE
jgi:type IV pilus assembly protein PilO